jgi:tetratricopeptide (TPR) repeat protein
MKWLLDLLSNFRFFLESSASDLGRWFSSGFSLRADRIDYQRPPWLTALLLPILIPIWLILGIFKALTFPFRIGSLGEERRKMLLWGLPALLCVSLVVTGVIYTWMNQDKIKGRYMSRMQEAIKLKDFNLASVLAERVIQESPVVDPYMRMKYAIILAEKGDQNKALSIINDLAPDDQIGFAAAHQMKAAQLAQQLRQNRDEETIKKFRWHLDHANTESSEQLEMLWAFYYSTVNQDGNVIEHMERASRLNPVHLVTLAELYRKLGKSLEADRSLREAEKIFDRKLGDDPLDRPNRLQLALVKSKLRKIDEAEQILLKGIAINNDESTRRSTADFYLMRYDLLRTEKEPFDQQFVYLQKAIALDSNYPPVYDRLLGLYANAPDSQSVQELKQLLRDMIVNGKSAAMAHFALGSIFLMDGDANEAKAHLRQAFNLDSKMPVVCNNLAWILAHNSDSNQISEAYQLSMQAVAADPTNTEFRDTLGIVLMKQEKFEEAITEFERALPKAVSKKPIHRNLAICYDKLGRIEMSQSHAEKAKE